MDFWRKNIDQIIQSNGFVLLDNKGSISKKQMERIVLSEYDQFDERRKFYEAEIADRQDEEELRQLESRVKSRKREG